MALAHLLVASPVANSVPAGIGVCAGNLRRPGPGSALDEDIETGAAGVHPRPDQTPLPVAVRATRGDTCVSGHPVRNRDLRLVVRRLMLEAARRITELARRPRGRSRHRLGPSRTDHAGSREDGPGEASTRWAFPPACRSGLKTRRPPTLHTRRDGPNLSVLLPRPVSSLYSCTHGITQL